MSKSFPEWNAHVQRMYGRRCAHFLPSIADRLKYFYIAYADASDAVRVMGVNGIYPIAIARLLVRVFLISHHFGDLPLLGSLTMRFGGGACGYCKKCPCDCPDKGRDDITLVQDVDPRQAEWTIGEWQKHLDLLYGAKNRQHGIQNILCRLVREHVEFQSIVDDSQGLCFRERGETVLTLRRKLAHELADVFAWILALATALEVDAEQALETHFGNGCDRCREAECVCTFFEFRLADWKNLPPERVMKP